MFDWIRGLFGKKKEDEAKQQRPAQNVQMGSQVSVGGMAALAPQRIAQSQKPAAQKKPAPFKQLTPPMPLNAQGKEEWLDNNDINRRLNKAVQQRPAAKPAQVTQMQTQPKPQTPPAPQKMMGSNFATSTPGVMTTNVNNVREQAQRRNAEVATAKRSDYNRRLNEVIQAGTQGAPGVKLQDMKIAGDARGRSVAQMLNEHKSMDANTQRNTRLDIQKQLKEMGQDFTDEGELRRYQLGVALEGMDANKKKTFATTAKDLGRSLIVDPFVKTGEALADVADAGTGRREKVHADHMSTANKWHEAGMKELNGGNRQLGKYYMSLADESRRQAQRAIDSQISSSDPVRAAGSVASAAAMPFAFAAQASGVGAAARAGVTGGVSKAATTKVGDLVRNASPQVAGRLANTTAGRVLNSTPTQLVAKAIPGASARLQAVAGESVANVLSGLPLSPAMTAQQLGSGGKLEDYLIEMATGSVIDAAFPVAAYGAGVGVRKGAQAVQASYNMAADGIRSVQQTQIDELVRRGMSPQQAHRVATQGGYLGGESAVGFEAARQAGRVFEGVDGLPRFEGDDSAALMMPKSLMDKAAETDPYKTYRAKVSDVLDHPKLFEDYPELKDINIHYDSEVRDYQGAWYDPKENEITLGAGLTEAQMKEGILHELQHAIQSREGMAMGTSPSAAGSFDDYLRSAGEAEARVVGARANMPMSERYVKPQDTWYHGTNAEFDKFDQSKIGSTTDDGIFGRGFYFSNDRKFAEQAPRGGAKRVMEVQPKLDNPLDLSKFKTKKELADYLDMSEDALYQQDEGGLIRPTYNQISQFTSQAKEMGHDGVLAPHTKYGARGDELVVFDADKIAKAQPRSTFYDSLDVPKEKLIVRRDIHPDDQKIMAAAIDHARGIEKLDDMAARELELDAARIAEHYGIDVKLDGKTNPLTTLANAFDQRLMQDRYGKSMNIDAEQYIRDTIAQYDSAEEFFRKTVDDLWAENKKGKGVESVLVREDNGNDVIARHTASNNSKFYQDYYAEFGKAPTKRDIEDMVRQTLDPEYEGVVTNVIDEWTLPKFDVEVYKRLREGRTVESYNDKLAAARAMQSENRTLDVELSEEIRKLQDERTVLTRQINGLDQKRRTAAMDDEQLGASFEREAALKERRDAVIAEMRALKDNHKTVLTDLAQATKEVVELEAGQRKAFQALEKARYEEGQAAAKQAFERSEADAGVQSARRREQEVRQVSEAIERGITGGPQNKVSDIIDTAAELGFVPRRKVEKLLQKYADDNGYEIVGDRAFKKSKLAVPTLDGVDGKIRPLDEIQPTDEALKRIRKAGVTNAVPYGDTSPEDAMRQMVYRKEDGTTGTFFEYRTPDGKWQKSGIDAVDVTSLSQGAKIQKIRDDAAINKEAQRIYSDGGSAQYIWRENDAGTNTEFVRDFDAAMGDAGKIDSNKIVAYDPDRHYIEAGKVVDGETGQIMGNYIEITPSGVNMFAGRQRISIDYDNLDLAKVKEMKSSGVTWTTEGIIDRITGNLKRTNTVNYFKKGGDKTKESLMHVMVEEPRSAQRRIIDEDNALGEAVNAWEKQFNSTVAKGKLADMRRDAVYAIEPEAPKPGEKAPSFEQRLEVFKENYGEAAAKTLSEYNTFMRGVYDNLLVRMNHERLAIGQTEIKRRNNYITHIAEMVDNGILKQSIQGINNILGGDVATDTRGALPAAITGTTGDRKPKSKYNPFSMSRLADNKPLNPFDPLRVYSNLALQNIHMTKAATMNRAIETTVRGLSEAKKEAGSSQGIRNVAEMLHDVTDKMRNERATADEVSALSRKLYGLSRAFGGINDMPAMQRLLRKAAKNDGKLEAGETATFTNAAAEMSDYLADKMNDVDFMKKLTEEADGLQQFVGIVQEHTNKLTGKTNWLVRGMKDLEKSKGTNLALTLLKGSQQHAALTSIVGNLSSAINQALAAPLVIGTTRPKFQLEGLRLMNDKGLMRKSDAMWLRYRDSQLMKKSKFQKVMEVGGIPLLTIERATMQFTFAAKYAEALGRGLDERQAIKYAERFIGDTTSWRDVASAPRIYDAPLGAMLQFTREVTQQYRGFWNRFTKAEKAGTLVAVWAMTNLFEQITGNKPGADPIGAGIEIGADVFGLKDEGRDEEANSPWSKAFRAGQTMLSEVVSAVPIASSMVNFATSKSDREKIFGSESTLGRYEGNMAMFTALGNVIRGSDNLLSGNPDQAWKDFLKTSPMGSQLQKSASGLQAMVRGYTTTSTGKVRTTVDQGSAVNWVKALLFGPNALKEQRKAFDSNQALNNKQQEVFDTIKASGGDPRDYANSIFAARDASKAAKDANTAGMDETKANYAVKIKSGEWREENGLIVNKNGDVQRKYYADLAKASKTQDDSSYDLWMKAYNIDGASNRVKAKKAANGILAKLEEQDESSNKASTAIAFMKNADKFKDLPDWAKERYYKEAGFTKEQVEYGAMASYSVVEKMDGYWRPRAGEVSREELVQELANGRRKSIDGKNYWATTGIIDNLQKEGYLSKSEAKMLKGINFDSKGNRIESAGGSGRGGSAKGGKGKSSESVRNQVDSLIAKQSAGMKVPDTPDAPQSSKMNTKKQMQQTQLQRYAGGSATARKAPRISVRRVS